MTWRIRGRPPLTDLMMSRLCVCRRQGQGERPPGPSCRDRQEARRWV